MVRAAVLDLVAHTRRRRPGGAPRRSSPTPPPLALLAAATPGPDAGLADRLAEMAQVRPRTAPGPTRPTRSWRRAGSPIGAPTATLPHPRRRRHDRRGARFEAEAMIPAIENLLDTAIRNSVLGYLAILLGRTGQAERALGRAWELCDPIRRRHRRLDLPATRPGRADPRGRAFPGRLGRPRHGPRRGRSPGGGRGPRHARSGHRRRGRPHEGLAEYRAMARRVRHGAQLQRVTMGHGWLHLVLGELDEARAELESAIPTTTLGGSSRISLWASGWLARVHFLAGDWDLALRTVAQGLRRAERTGIVIVSRCSPGPPPRSTACGATRSGRSASCATPTAAPTTTKSWRPRRLARASMAEVRADYGAVVRLSRPSPQRSTPPSPSPAGGPGATSTRTPSSSRATSTRPTNSSPATSSAPTTSRTRRARAARWARGRLHAARGDLDRARRVRDLDRVPRHPAPALGPRPRPLRLRPVATPPVPAPRGRHHPLDGPRALPRPRREQLRRPLRPRAAGRRRAPARPDRGIGDLTAQETAVADLVARGLSNKDAATELHVSPKTVQYHLTRIYTKLGVRSRTELAGLHRDKP